MKHKHAELIKLWADGAEIQFKDNHGEWRAFGITHPIWFEDWEYRIKPPQWQEDLRQAVRDGKTIEIKHGDWMWSSINENVDTYLFGVFTEDRYRIKPEPKPDDEITRLIKQRDSYRGWADRLANAISEHFEYDIGEHSSANCPWTNAMVCIESPQAIKPKQKPDVESYFRSENYQLFFTIHHKEASLKIKWDGETGEPKSAEVLK